MKEGKGGGKIERKGRGREGKGKEKRREEKEEGGVCVTWCWLQFIVVGFLDHFNHITLGGVARSCDTNTKIM